MPSGIVYEDQRRRTFKVGGIGRVQGDDGVDRSLGAQQPACLSRARPYRGRIANCHIVLARDVTIVSSLQSPPRCLDRRQRSDSGYVMAGTAQTSDEASWRSGPGIFVARIAASQDHNSHYRVPESQQVLDWPTGTLDLSQHAACGPNRVGRTNVHAWQ